MSPSRRVRGRITRFAQEADPPTLPGVFLERGAYQARVGESADQGRTYEVMQVALRCGTQLLARGAAAVDVESAVHAAATALGLSQVEVDVTYNSIYVSATHNGLPLSTSRVVRQGTTDYERLTMVHQLLTDIINGDVGLAAAAERIDELERRRRYHSRGVVLLANGVLAGAIALVLGAGWLITAVAAATGLAVMWLVERMSGPRTPVAFTLAAGGVVAVASAAVVTSLKLDARPSLVVAAGIVVLLPSVTLVGAVRDALVGFPVTAAGRAVDGTMQVIGIVAGVLLGLFAVSAASVTMSIIPTDEAAPVPVVLRLLAGGVAAACAAVAYQATWHVAALAMLVGGLSFGVSSALLLLVESPALALGATAVVVGAASAAMAQRTRTLALIYVVPGLLPLLPGLVLYRGTLILTSGETIAGLVVLLDAAVRMLALAGGALLGELLVSKRVRR